MRREPRVGLMAYSTNTGLGVLTHEFAVHLHPTKVLLADISSLNGVQTHHERFAAFDHRITDGRPSVEDIEWFLTGIDVAFIHETPLDYRMFERARQRGVKTVLQPNHEFNDYYANPALPLPDLFALPSPWHYDDLPYENKTLLHVPVATERLPHHTGQGIRRFLHIVGKPSVHDRNGTQATIEAFKRVKAKNARLTIRIQGEDAASALMPQISDDPRITLDWTDVYGYWEMYAGFDCLVMPRRFGGLCLPMQEALGCGMPVIMPDISPNNAVLPAEWLVPATHEGTFTARREIDLYTADTTALAAKMDEFCALSDNEADAVYATARSMGAELGWDRQIEEYRETFRRLVSVKHDARYDVCRSGAPLTVFCPFTRPWAVKPFFEALKASDVPIEDAAFVAYVDSDDAALYAAVEEMALALPFRSVLIRFSGWAPPGEKADVKTRRRRQAIMRHTSQMLVGDGEVLLLEDDTLIPPDAYSKLTKSRGTYDWVIGTAVGRWGKRAIGAWHISMRDGVPIAMESLMVTDKRRHRERVDATGFYCVLTSAEVYRLLDLTTWTNEMAYDVYTTWQLTLAGRTLGIDWTVPCVHTTESERLTVDMAESYRRDLAGVDCTSVVTIGDIDTEPVVEPPKRQPVRPLNYPVPLALDVTYNGVLYPKGTLIDRPTAVGMKRVGLLHDERIV